MNKVNNTWMQSAKSFAKRFLETFGYTGPEKDVQNVLKKIIKPNGVCADVGANVGVITKLMAKLVGSNGEVIAFEAYPENATILQNEILRHNFQNVAVENIAVTDGMSKTVKLYPGREFRSAEWNILGHDVDGMPTEAELEISATSLDNYFEHYHRLDVVKVDVEGAGGLVFSGMEKILSTFRPILMIEFHDEAEWQSREILHASEYSLYTLKGIRLSHTMELARVYHSVAIPNEKEFPR